MAAVTRTLAGLPVSQPPDADALAAAAAAASAAGDRGAASPLHAGAGSLATSRGPAAAPVLRDPAWFLSAARSAPRGDGCPAPACASPVVLAVTGTHLLELWPAEMALAGHDAPGSTRRVMVVSQAWSLDELAGEDEEAAKAEAEAAAARAAAEAASARGGATGAIPRPAGAVAPTLLVEDEAPLSELERQPSPPQAHSACPRLIVSVAALRAVTSIPWLIPSLLSALVASTRDGGGPGPACSATADLVLMLLMDGDLLTRDTVRELVAVSQVDCVPGSPDQGRVPLRLTLTHAARLSATAGGDDETAAALLTLAAAAWLRPPLSEEPSHGHGLACSAVPSQGPHRLSNPGLALATLQSLRVAPLAVPLNQLRAPAGPVDPPQPPAPHGASAPMPVMDATLPFWTAFAMSAHGGAAAGRRTEWAGSPAAPRLAAPRAAALLVASVAQAAPHALDAVLALLPTGSGTSLADGHVPFFSPATHAALGRLSRATAGKLAAGVLATRSVPVALMRSPVIPLLVGDGAPSPVLRALACWLGDPAMQAAGPVAGTVRAVAPSGWAPPRLAAAAIFAMLHAADAARPTATHATVRPSLRLSPSLFCLCDAVSTLTVTREPRLGPATLLSVVSAPWVRPFRRYIVRRLARPPAPAPQAVSAGNRSPAPPADAPAEAAGVVLWEADLSRPSVHLPPDTLVEVADAALAAYAEGMRLAGIADIAAKSAASFVGAVRRSCGGGAAEFGGGGDGFGRHAAQPSGASVTVAGSVASVGAAAAPATSIGLDAELVAYRAPRHRERAAYLRAAGAALTLGVQVKGRAQAAAAFMAQRWPQLLARAAGMVGAAAAASQGLPAGDGSVISGIGGRAAPRSIGRSSVAGDARDVQLPWLRRVMGEAKLTVALGDGVLAAAAGGGTVPQAAASSSASASRGAGAPLALFEAAGPFSLALDAVSAFAALHATAEGPLLRALRASLGFAADSLDAAGSPESVEGAAGAVWDSWRGSGAAMADTLVSLLESAAATAAALTRTVEELPAGIPPRMLAVRPDAVVRLARLGVVTLALVLLPSVLSDSAAAPDRVVAERRRLCARVSRAMLLCLVTACPPGMVPR
ncbi:hypothetical protein FNF28_07777 [Cafeteria roenbergensis]|uniref:Uncharacterized protein n=1 Tax=Cafeteria roenbergensis TaxID=33653 RepID=A0A5A8C1W0_CAFRO|nr:hypothetical protein FNF28_07777 [Cafeteria roenbergensis]